MISRLGRVGCRFKRKGFHQLLLAFAFVLNLTLLIPAQPVAAQAPAGCPGGSAGQAAPGTFCPDGSNPVKDPSLPFLCPGSGSTGLISPGYRVTCPARPGRSECVYTDSTQRCITVDGKDVTNGDGQSVAGDPRVTVASKPVSTITKPEDAKNVGDDIITLKKGANILNTQKVKAEVVNGALTYTATFNPVAPGNYTTCSEKATSCVDFTKAATDVNKRIEIPGKNPNIGPPGAEEEKVCSTGTGLASALAWILCPLTQLMVDATGFIERNLIIPFLTVSPLQVGDNPVYKLWESVRNIANVAFIIAFFMVIFSQATSIGISNYGIKRLLPRLAIVAIGTNMSFFVVAFAIDAFNVFGAGISDLVMSAISGGGGGGGTDPNAGNIFAVTAIAGVGLTLAVFATTAKAVLGWIIWMIGIAFLILLLVVIVLVIRQMIIILLVIVSPLAFVAWLLPNTEKYFTKWRGMLIQLLMMYPLIVLLFASGKIMQRIIVSYNFDLTSGNGSAEGFAEAVKVGVGFFAAVAPLVLLPFTFAAAGGLMGKIYGAIRTRGGQVAKKGAEKAGERLKPWLENKQLQASKSKNRFVRSLGSGRQLRRDAARAQREREYGLAKDQYLAQQMLGGNKRLPGRAAGIGGQAGISRGQAQAVATVEKAEKEELENSLALLTAKLKTKKIDQKTFAGGDLARYLKNGEDRHGYSEMFKQDPSLFRAALHSAAAQGEIATVEAARLATGLAGTGDAATGRPNRKIDQNMVDQVVRLNDGKLKEKGGYHLATNFELAAGRSGTAAAPPPTIEQLTSSDVSIQTAARQQQAAAEQNVKNERVLMIAQSASDDIAGMKAGLLADTGELLSGPKGDATLRALDAASARGQQEAAAKLLQSNPAATPTELQAARDSAPNYRRRLLERMRAIANNPNTLNRSGAAEAVRKMRKKLAQDSIIRDAPDPLLAATLQNEITTDTSHGA